MGCLKLLNNSENLFIVGGTKYQPLAIAYKREAELLNESVNSNYTYDAVGNITSMPHLPKMTWDFADRLKFSTNGNVNTWYCYDANGERTRKVTQKDGGIKEERMYLNGYEVYRKYVNGSLDTERTTLHVMDDTKTAALVETDTLQNNVTVRYQYDNHLGSACLELNENADIISYEEYHPFGTTSYRSGRNDVDVSLKRYKYVGKERDEETGLYYYGARYYAAWLCRFVSVDPLQFEYPDLTPFQYASNRPIVAIDIDGLEAYYMLDGKKIGQVEKNTNVRLINKGIKLEDAKKAINLANKVLNTVNSKSDLGKMALETINLFSKKNSTSVGMNEAELNLRASLSTLKQTEAGRLNEPLDYNNWNNNKNFTEDSYAKNPKAYSTHPGTNPDSGSSAAGAYQFLKRFYNESDFSPQNQDRAAVNNMTSSSYSAALSGNMVNFKETTEERWTSLKHWKVPELQKVFTYYIVKELSGNSIIKTPVGRLLKNSIL